MLQMTQGRRLNRPDPRDPTAEAAPVVPPADELDILESMPEMEMDISPDIEAIQVPMSESRCCRGPLDAGRSWSSDEGPRF